MRFAPVGVQDGLETVDLAGAVSVDPSSDDFFRLVIEQRKRLKTRADLTTEDRNRLDAFLKTLANATSYGIYAQFDRHDLPSTPTSHTPKHPDRSAFPRWQRASLLAPD